MSLCNPYTPCHISNKCHNQLPNVTNVTVVTAPLMYAFADEEIRAFVDSDID